MGRQAIFAIFNGGTSRKILFHQQIKLERKEMHSFKRMDVWISA